MLISFQILLTGKGGMEMDEATTGQPQACHNWKSRGQEAGPQSGPACTKLFCEREAFERYVLFS